MDMQETELTINGVKGRRMAVAKWPSDPKLPERIHGLIANQTWKSEARPVKGYGPGAMLTVSIRHDDNYKNGHESFGITGDIYKLNNRNQRVSLGGGCCHDDIAATFPELAPLIKWHLSSTDGPMHYIANTIYHAGDRDHNGRKTGEPTAWSHVAYFGNSPVAHTIKGGFMRFLQSRMVQTQDGYKIAPEFESFQVVGIAHDSNSGDYKFSPHYTFAGFGEKWHECPFSDYATASQWAEALNTIGCRFDSIPTDFSKGKERDLTAARSCAIWPEATDYVLMLPKEELSKLLQERVPGLLSEFKKDIESAGLIWTGANN